VNGLHRRNSGTAQNNAGQNYKLCRPKLQTVQAKTTHAQNTRTYLAKIIFLIRKPDFEFHDRAGPAPVGFSRVNPVWLTL